MKLLVRASRSLARHPRYTILAVMTLAAGIGANAAVFGLLDAIFLRPLPLHDPGRLATLTLESPGSRFGMFSYPEFLEIQRSAPALQDVVAIGQRGVTLQHRGEVHSLIVHYVSGRYFPSLGIPMHLGRGFVPDDDTPAAAAPQVVINHHVWSERLGAPDDIIGRTITLNDTAFTVIGVTAPGFVGLGRIVRTDVWVTTAQAPFVVGGLRDEMEDRRHRWFNIMGRLADGASVQEAGAALDVLVDRWRSAASGAAAGDYAQARVVVRPHADATREATRQGLVFLGLVGLVVLLASANVANLTLARGEGRHREFALRSALGGSRPALMREMLLESALVAGAGTVLGLLLAGWLIRLVPAFLPPGPTPLMIDVRLDGRVLAFSIGLGLMATALVGLLPAWRASRPDLMGVLKQRSAGTASAGRGFQLRDALVIGEIALSGVLLIAAGLLVRSLTQSLALDPGFDASKPVATFYMVPALKGHDLAGTYRYFEAARERTAALPDVARASYGIRLPAQANEAGWSAAFSVPGHEPPTGRDAFEFRYTMVGPDYFAVMGTPILGGRGILDTDRPDSVPIAVVSQSMARRFWPDGDPLGQRIRMGRTRPVDLEIVGVAADIRIGGLYEAPEPFVYVPFAQRQQGFGLLLVETARDTATVTSAVKRVLTEIDSSIPVLAVNSFAGHMDVVLYEERRNAWLAAAVALLALTLGAVGVHGVVSLVTLRRTRELGIRAALGADRRTLLRLLLGRGVQLTAAGALLGIGGGLAAGRLLEHQLHGIDPTDAATLTAATVVLVAVALSASFLPAWRAARVDPVVALKEE
jgi:putative ABC transport system permease protein